MFARNFRQKFQKFVCSKKLPYPQKMVPEATSVTRWNHKTAKAVGHKSFCIWQNSQKQTTVHKGNAQKIVFELSKGFMDATLNVQRQSKTVAHERNAWALSFDRE